MLTTKQVAQKLGMGINQTRKLIQRDDFPKITVGTRKWLIPDETLDEWLKKSIYKKY